MMISPFSYIKDKQNWSLDELYEEKRKLKNEMKELRKEIKNIKNNKDILITCPTPDTQLSVYKKYLSELDFLIMQKELEKNKVLQ